MYIYKTTNLINGKIYIGQCSKPVEKSKFYLGSGVHLGEAIKKYGKHNFKKEILKDKIKDQKTLDVLEKYYIKKFNSTDTSVGYNILIGATCEGAANPMYRPGVVEKMMLTTKMNGGNAGERNSFFGRKHTEETKKIIREKRKNQICSEETKEKMSESQKLRFETSPTPMKGRTHTDETKEKLRISSTGRKHTEETKEKMSVSLKEAFSKPESKKKRSESAKQNWKERKERGDSIEYLRKIHAKRQKVVLQYDLTGKVLLNKFSCAKEASESVSLSKQLISKCCLRNSKNKTDIPFQHGGSIWKYE